MFKINFKNYNFYALALLILSIFTVFFDVSNLNKVFWAVLVNIVFFIRYLNLTYKNFISSIISLFAIYIQLRIDLFILSKEFFINILIILIILKFSELNQKRGHYFFNFISLFIATSSLSYGQDFISSLNSSLIFLISIIHLYLLNQKEMIKLNLKSYIKIISISFLFIPLIILLYFIIPRQEINLSLLTSKDKSLGIPDIITLGTFDKISNSNEDVFTYNDNSNNKEKKYFRVKVFDKLDNQKNWLSSKNHYINDNLKIIQNDLSKKEKIFLGRVILKPHHNKWIPIIKNTRVLDDNFIYSDLTSTVAPTKKIKNKKIYYLKIDPKILILNPKLIDKYTTLPNSISDELKAWATKEYKNSKNEKDYIKKVLKKFSNDNFYYSLTPKNLGNNYSKFFFDTKEGYCEYYAGIFTILTRIVKIPSRIITGFYGGDYNAYGNFYEFKQSDAHAWVEVWFKETGWIRIDPTSYIPKENIIESNNLNLPDAKYLNEKNVIFSKTLKNIFNYIQYLDYQWTTTFTQYDKKSRDIILNKIYNKKNLFIFLKNLFIPFCISFVFVIFFRFVFNKKLIFFILISKLKNKGFKIKNYHTHQRIFNSLNIKEKKELRYIFTCYEKIKFKNVKNEYYQILKFNFLVLRYYFLNR